MENLKLKLRTYKKLPRDLDTREKTLKELVDRLNKRANTNSGAYECFNLACESLKYRRAKGTKIGWGFYNDREIEMWFSGELDPKKILDSLKRRRHKVIETQGLEKEYEESEDLEEKEKKLKEIFADRHEHSISIEELAERIAIETAHAHEDEYSGVKYNQAQ